MRARVGIGFRHLPFLGCLAFGCGAPPTSQLVVDNSSSVTIYADGERGQRPAAVDRSDPRVQVAERQIAELLKHPLGFELDSAVAAGFGDDLQRAYLSALERVASSLARCQEREPAAFAFGARSLSRIRLTYDHVSAEPTRPPELVESTLVMRVRPESAALLDASELCPAFKREQALEQAERFAKVDPGDVPADEQADYLEYLLRLRGNPEDATQRQVDELGQALRLLSFYPHVVQPEKRAELEAWLTYFGSRLVYVLRQSSNDAIFVTARGKAQRAWIQWVNTHGARLGRVERERLAELLFSREKSVELAQGFDSVAFGLPILEHWIENAAFADPRRAPDKLHFFVVCAAEHQRADDPALSVLPFCSGALFGDLAATPEGRRRLAARLRQHKNELLTQTALLHALRARDASTVALLLDELVEDAPTLRTALKALADYEDWRLQRVTSSRDGVVSDPSALLALVPRFWKSLPEQRPVLLYLLVQLAHKRANSVALSKLPEFLGSRIDAAALAGFLAEGGRTLWVLPELLPSLSPGFSRSDVILPGLLSWLDADARSRDSNAYYVTQRLVDGLCAAGLRSDVAALQRSLRARAERYSTQTQRLGSIIESSPEALCPELKRRKVGSSPEPVWFGD
jgi:hypothetical protein